LGICFDPLCVITELLDGSVEVLIDDFSIELDERTILQMALDAACGVLHLHSSGILHCDLACRNLLVNNIKNSLF